MQGILRGNRDIGRIFEPCDGLDDDSPDQRDAKKYLTQLLLIKACNAYENEIGRIVYEKMKKSCDNEAASFISSGMLAYKHLSLDALKGNIVGRFGNERKRAFAGRIEGSSAESAYNSIINARNAVAHGRSTTMTYSDLKRGLDDADRVLVELAAVLGSGQRRVIGSLAREPRALLVAGGGLSARSRVEGARNRPTAGQARRMRGIARSACAGTGAARPASAAGRLPNVMRVLSGLRPPDLRLRGRPGLRPFRRALEGPIAPVIRRRLTVRVGALGAVRGR